MHQACVVKNSASKPKPATSKEVSVDGVFVGGVFVGRRLRSDAGTVVYAEEITERRFVIRKQLETNYAMRIGEVCGGEQYGGGTEYQATTNAGVHVACTRTFKSAVKKLVDKALA